MKKSNGKVLTFMRKNAVYFVLALCILAVGLSITFMLINGEGNSATVELPEDPPTVNTPIVPDEPSDPVITPDDPAEVEPVDKPITFIMPVETVISIGDYSDTMVWNGTMGWYSAHKEIAASIPPIPPPITATFFCFFAGSR